MKFIIWSLLFLYPFLSFSEVMQVSSADTLYTDTFGTLTTKEKATYYVLLKDMHKKITKITWIQETYYMQNDVLAETCPMVYIKKQQGENYSSVKSYFASAVRNGIMQCFYKNGKIFAKYNYKNGQNIGYYSTYHENGRLKSSGTINDGKMYVFEYFDSTGLELLNQGNGLIEIYNLEDHQTYFLEVSDSIRVSAFFIDSAKGDTVYTVLKQGPVPTKGWSHFYRELSKSIDRKQRKAFSDQQLDVEFIVREDGSFDKIKKLNTLSPEVDEKIVKRLLEFSPFQSAQSSNGKKVKYLCSVPVYIIDGVVLRVK